ncbi:GMP/IMP nucleotidase [Thiobacter aerophilum]|uniref:GMP/IMP nucleotidase n=1 Tax=Thiobacter aerophilum TaxID=3121275 RepID=A0ABV0EBB0_9BURK
MLNWDAIDTVLLDMDGTLLDLHYDNHFWLEHVPRRYAEKHGIPAEEARAQLRARYDRLAGSMQWYCVDYWSRELELDIARLKREVAHLIAVHSDVVPFLEAVRALGKRVVLVTNAHQVSLALKMEQTGLARFFDRLVCAHEFGVPKEEASFWTYLAKQEPFAPDRTLLIDDSLPVLRSARAHGIRHLLAVAQPDTRAPRKQVEEFPVLTRFADVTPFTPT